MASVVDWIGGGPAFVAFDRGSYLRLNRIDCYYRRWCRHSVGKLELVAGEFLVVVDCGLVNRPMVLDLMSLNSIASNVECVLDGMGCLVGPISTNLELQNKCVKYTVSYSVECKLC